MKADLRATRANLPLVIGALGILLIAFVALFGSRLSPYDPQAWRIVEFYDGRIVVPPSAPDSHHLLGTDPLGRDQLSRLLWGAQLSLTVTLLAVLVRVSLGVAVGGLLAMARGVGASALTGLTNVVSGYPQLLLALLVGVALRDLGVAGFVVALGIVGWPELGRFLGVELRRIAQSPFVEAARSTGASPWRVAVSHVARNALPQLVGLTALEIAAVLLLLAELGFIGLFVAGSVSFSDDFGRPVLPVRDRAPEWGQMLAGALDYATNRQWVAYVPALVVVSAVFVFNLFGEGIRAALNPHGQRVLSPGALGWAARGLAALVLVGASGFALSSVLASGGLTYEQGLTLARAAAERERPGSRLIAGVVRFSSQGHALDRPEKLNYYFLDPKGAPLRVGYPDADANQAEFRFLEDDDGLGDLSSFLPIGDAAIGWQEALATGERDGGNAYRSSVRSWVSRVVLRQAPSGPVWRVRYGPVIGPLSLEVAIDARTGSTDLPLTVRLGDAYDQIVRQLGAEPVIARLGASWRPPGPNSGLGEDAPFAWSFDFVRADGLGPVVHASLQLNGTTQIFQSQQAPRPAPLPSVLDPQPLFARVEKAGGRAVRAEWERDLLRDWFAFSTLEMVDGTPRFTVTYRAGERSALFRLDVATGEVRRIS